MKKPKTGMRTVKFWMRYRPKSRQVIEFRQFRREISTPSRESGDVVFQCKGFYFPTRDTRG
jgi:hypothetical protein